jgi:hypothetical protein
MDLRCGEEREDTLRIDKGNYRKFVACVSVYRAGVNILYDQKEQKRAVSNSDGLRTNIQTHGYSTK